VLSLGFKGEQVFEIDSVPLLAYIKNISGATGFRIERSLNRILSMPSSLTRFVAYILASDGDYLHDDYCILDVILVMLPKLYVTPLIVFDQCPTDL
jgi:hypothetical protein